MVSAISIEYKFYVENTRISGHPKVIFTGNKVTFSYGVSYAGITYLPVCGSRSGTVLTFSSSGDEAC